MTARAYPDEAAGPFPSPPGSFEDGDGREVEISRYDGEYDRLVEMYGRFDPADRAQGIPPSDEAGIERWLDEIVSGGIDVVASHDGRAIGHATLVPDDETDSYELAIFVLQEYQGAGVGTRLMEYLLGAGADDGIDRVWLTVERWNTPAIALYEKVGFEPCGTDSFELQMSIRLDAA